MTNTYQKGLGSPPQPSQGSIPLAAEQNAKAIKRLFAGVTARSRSEVLESFDPEVVIHEAQSLPYGGDYVGLKGLQKHIEGYTHAWNDLQGPDEKSMDPQILTGEDLVAVAWHQRGRNPSTGEAFEAPVMSLYRLADGKVTDSRMFHFDSAAVRDFLERSHGLNTIGTAESQLNELIVAGQFETAFEKFYAQGVEMRESGSRATKGKQANQFREAALFKIVTNMTAQCLGGSAMGQTTYSQWNYTIQVKSGKTLSYSQVAVRQWGDGLVVDEQFYHPDFPSWFMMEIAAAAA